MARLKRDRDLADRYADPFKLAAAKLADAQVLGTKLDLEAIDHAVDIAGIDHVGLSSHAQNVPQWKEFTEALLEHGYTQGTPRRFSVTTCCESSVRPYDRWKPKAPT